MSESAKNIDRITIRLPNWVGDAVMATPALRSIRRGYPSAHICVVGRPGILKILEQLPFFDDRIPLVGKGLKRDLSLAVRLWKRSFDLGLILPNSFSSALSFYLGRVKRRTGYALNGRSFMLNRSIRPEMEGMKRRPTPMTHYYLELARFCGGAETTERMELKTRPEHDAEADRLLAAWGADQAAMRVGLNPGASFGPSKLWTPEGFARVADRVSSEMEGKAILLCGPDEEEIADAIMERAEHPIVDTSRAVLPLDLLKSVMARLDALVTTDTGPRHFAAALGVPVVVIMGPTDPRYTETNMDLTRVIRVDADCSPCHKKVCDTDHRCMQQIDGDRVFSELKDMLVARRS
ncbi:MAG: lipopolysaccharide heptosyltransferase II [Planctomycetota bacterium]|jgi:heptosyltransferase-2